MSNAKQTGPRGSYKEKRKILKQYFDLSEKTTAICLICKNDKTKHKDPTYKTPNGKRDNLYKHLQIHENHGHVSLGDLFKSNKKLESNTDHSESVDSEDDGNGFVSFLEVISDKRTASNVLEFPSTNNSESRTNDIANFERPPYADNNHLDGDEISIGVFDLNLGDLKQWLQCFKRSMNLIEDPFVEVKKYLTGEMLLFWYEFNDRQSSSDFDLFEQELLKAFYPKNKRSIFKHMIRNSSCEESAMFLIKEFNGLSLDDAFRLAFYLHENDEEANQFLADNHLEISNQKKKLVF